MDRYEKKKPDINYLISGAHDILDNDTNFATI